MSGSEGITRLHLEQIAAGTLDDPAIIARVEADPELLAELEGIRRDNELLGEFMSIDPTPAPAHDFDPIAGYELLDEIHRGGQGIVQRARQRAADRMVAVKTLLQGAFASETQRIRFEREVRLVARLNHPSIVTVFESGRTALGSHYIVMELIEGVPVDEYAAVLRAGGDYRGIARLFVEIADAVRYAHQRGVIHRDLKPGNILVDDAGRPHILDFGIAQTFGDAHHAEPVTTRTGEFMGTLAYASPEQIASEPGLIDVRSDVYALGVLLYLTLTGRRPIATTGSLVEVIARIAAEIPPYPSTLNPALDSDLDTITMTALAKSVAERYQTAAELRDDLTRWLEGRAIAARAHDFWYIARKTLLRHRVPVAIASMVLLLIVGFSIITGVLALNVRYENRSLHGTVQGLTATLAEIDRETAAEPVTTLPEFLTRLVKNIQSEVGYRPDVESAVRDAAGIAFIDDNTKLDLAEEQLVRAYELRQASLDAPDAALATSLQNLGRLRSKQGQLDDAEKLYRQALDMRIELFGTENASVARTMHHLAHTLQGRGELDESRGYWLEALRIRHAVLTSGHADIGNTLSGLATNSLERGDYARAATEAREALAIVLEYPKYGSDSLAAGRIKYILGVALCNLGQLDEAEVTLRETILTMEHTERSSVRPDQTEHGSVRLARAHGALARVLFRRGQLDDAEHEARIGREIRDLTPGRADQEINPELLLAEIALARNNASAALALAQAAILSLDDAHRPTGVWDRGAALHIRARCHARLAAPEAAHADAERADQILSRNRPDTDALVLENLRLIALLNDELDRPGDSIARRIRAAESHATPTNEQPEP